jgi:chromosome segregation ATPase
MTNATSQLSLDQIEQVLTLLEHVKPLADALKALQRLGPIEAAIAQGEARVSELTREVEALEAKRAALIGYYEDIGANVALREQRLRELTTKIDASQTILGDLHQRVAVVKAELDAAKHELLAK